MTDQSVMTDQSMTSKLPQFRYKITGHIYDVAKTITIQPKAHSKTKAWTGWTHWLV